MLGTECEASEQFKEWGQTRGPKPNYKNISNKMIFLLYTGTSALIIYISNIQGTKKYSAVMYYLNTVQSAAHMCIILEKIR